MLKRTPSYSPSLRQRLGLKYLDPLLRLSLTGLGELPASPAAEARFANAWLLKFREEWSRLRLAVEDLCFAAKQTGQQGSAFSHGQLMALHDDVLVLLRSRAGAFIFEYYQHTLLPPAMLLLLEHLMVRTPTQLDSSLRSVWGRFYSHTLPSLEAIFVHVKKQKLSIRQVTLIAFRDVVLLQLEARLVPLLDKISARRKVPSYLKQMFLVLQGVMEVYPPSEQRLRLEALTVRVVYPYQGHRGLYNGGPDPTVLSRELEVAPLRRPSVVDPKRILRPLSVNSSSRNVETLGDLFALSADRARSRTRTFNL